MPLSLDRFRTYTMKVQHIRLMTCNPRLARNLHYIFSRLRDRPGCQVEAIVRLVRFYSTTSFSFPFTYL